MVCLLQDGNIDVECLLKKAESMTRKALAATTAKTVSCPCCSTICQRPRLKAHILTHFDFPYKCSVCSMYFKNKEEEDAHKQEKHQKTFDCKICGNSYMHAIGLKTHTMLKHKPEQVQNWKCSVCQKIFPTKGRLKVHMNVHSDFRPYTCEHCGTSFKSLDTLKTHRTYIHEGVARKAYNKKHTCEFCGTEFCGASVLKEHILVKHTENAIFKHQCELCEKSFPRARRLEAHLNKEHYSRKPYVCQYCRKGFYTEMNCKRHKQICLKIKNKSESDSDRAQYDFDNTTVVTAENSIHELSLSNIYSNVLQS